MKNFQCYQLSIGAVRMVRPLIERIEAHDRDLGPNKKAPREAARGGSATQSCRDVRPP